MIVSISSLLLLPFFLSSTFAAKSSDERFTSLQKTHPIKLDDAKFVALTKGPRDFGSVILLTALDAKFGCGACHDFQPEWDLLSKSWQRGDRKGKTRTLFAELDFINGRTAFTSLGLQH